jgi:hypothetical protein
MNKYHIKSYHDVYEDTYQEGEGKFTNHFEINRIVEADEALDALEKYGKEVLGYEYDGYEVNTNNDVLSYDILINKDYMEATAKEITLWKKGKLTLYNDHITFDISIMQRITNLK